MYFHFREPVFLFCLLSHFCLTIKEVHRIFYMYVFLRLICVYLRLTCICADNYVMNSELFLTAGRTEGRVMDRHIPGVGYVCRSFRHRHQGHV